MSVELALLSIASNFLAAKRFANRGQMEDGKVAAAAQKQEQRKYLDPNGIKFDIVNDEHAGLVHCRAHAMIPRSG